MPVFPRSDCARPEQCSALGLRCSVAGAAREASLRTTNCIEAGRALVTGFVAAAVLLMPSPAHADRIQVAHLEGLAHGFVALHALDGALLASGDLTQHTTGSRVTTRLHLRFKDGSTHEETTVYTQRGYFRLVSNHVVQKGPAFKRQMESLIHRDGRVRIRYSEEDGQEKIIEDRVKLPPDIANGMILVALKNLPPNAPKSEVSFLAMTPKPKLVKLEITPAGEEPFSTAGIARNAMHYKVKVHVPGVTGVVAAVVGKLPPDSHLWVLRGEAPVFVRGETTLAADGPVWRLDVVSPTWPSRESSASQE